MTTENAPSYETEHPCTGKCAYGGCGKSGYTACGGCCHCRGGCVVDWEISQGIEQGDPPPPWPPQSQHGTWGVFGE